MRNDTLESNVKPAVFRGNGKPDMWVAPIKTQGGFIEGYGDNALLADQIEKIYFPFIGQECFAFEIEGSVCFRNMYRVNTSWVHPLNDFRT